MYIQPIRQYTYIHCTYIYILMYINVEVLTVKIISESFRCRIIKEKLLRKPSHTTQVGKLQSRPVTGHVRKAVKLYISLYIIIN